ncbi:hypothetical protein DM860_000995 [Cuscuta australis]|uniref:DUF4283 domain-containing protein n=1 Tax=Cuscuta australis TaxID=267555 RepID=A0A328DSJ8_9ASTE|nr:hypothetical protein DM860_000995 [Cuscuta australis]
MAKRGRPKNNPRNPQEKSIPSPDKAVEASSSHEPGRKSMDQITDEKEEEKDRIRYAKLLDEDIDENTAYWEAAAVTMETFDVLDVTFLKYGHFVVRFNSIEERDEAVAKAYYVFDNKPLYVRKWLPGSQVNLSDLLDIPIWVQLPELEMRFWSLNTLSKIRSLIGKPLRADKTTVQKSKMNYARLQVEVRMKQQFPEIIYFADRKDRIISQRVKYEWCPIVCTHCEGLGHNEERCRKKIAPRQQIIWRKKHTTVEEQKEELPHEKEAEENSIEGMITPEGNLLMLENVEEQNEGFTEVGKKNSIKKRCLRESFTMIAQGSREKRVTESDRDTAYFHAWVKKRRIHNHITSIQDNRGNKVEGTDRVVGVLLDCYKDLLGSYKTTKEIDTKVIEDGKTLNIHQQLELVM